LAVKRASNPPRFRAFARFLLFDLASGTKELGMGLVRDCDVDNNLEVVDAFLYLVAGGGSLRGNRVFLWQVLHS
jgi:hypothetical protein